jgi:molecular chaperone DnaK (HSP70)
MKIGIDIGSHSTKAARMTAEGIPSMIADGQTKLPFTFTLFQKIEGGFLVGNDAVIGLQNVDFANQCDWSLDKLGQSEPLLTDKKEQWYAETILALLFKKIKLDIDAYTITGAACAKPFSIPDQGLAIAAQLTDMPFGGCLDSAIAATLCYKPNDKKPVMVIDWGHSGVTVSLIQKTADSYQIIASEQKLDIGGKNWTEKLLALLLKRFGERFGEIPTTARQSLTIVAENLKEQLSNSQYASQNVVVESEMLSITVNRSEFEVVIENDVLQFGQLLEKCLKQTDSDSIETVILTGGCMFVPLAKNAIKRHLPNVKKWYETESISSVAFGMARYASQITNIAKNDTDSLKYNFGVLSINPKIKNTEIDTIIRKNTATPARARRTYYMVNQEQRSINLTIVQFDTDSDDYELVGKIVIGPLLNAEANKAIEVSFLYSDEGVLVVTSYDPETGIETEHNLQANGTDGFQFAQQRQLVRTTAVNGVV